ncbi:MAG TPA: response regulator [Planctomycetes bacterium]|nr:response regulator [Planctomycetota bacterium]
MTENTTSPKRVLVVEDEPDFAALLETILTQAGFLVTTAYSCEDAFEAVRKTKPDLVTLDIAMPRKSGGLFYRQLKADRRFRYLPVVVVTGITRDDREMDNIVHSLLEPDSIPAPDAYVEKPIDGSSLVDTIRRVLESSPSGAGEPVP